MQANPANPGHRPPRLPAGIWVLGIVSLLMDVSSELIHSLLPAFLFTVIGASALTIGLIEGVAEAIALTVRVFSGALSDFLRRRKLLAVLGYGLSAIAKPLFAIAGSATAVFAARATDRVGKGIRGAPRDALIADLTKPENRGAAYGLRQSLDTTGAFLGPILAIRLMLLWSNDFRAVFWVAAIPAVLAVMLLIVGVHDARPATAVHRVQPLRRAELKRLGRAYWWIVAVGTLFALARFSDAFLILRAQDHGIPLAWLPLVFIAMNVVYAASAYPFGRLADSISQRRLLASGIAVLIAADLVLAVAANTVVLFAGIALWGLHMGITQGLLAMMVANASPPELRGTAFGVFNLFGGLALLLASAVAGLLWDLYGPHATFVAGALLASLALALVPIAAIGRNQ